MIPAPRLAFCLLVAGLCLFQAQGMSVPVDCCLSTKDTPLLFSWLPKFKDYKIQGTDGGCDIGAIVLITVRNRKLCYPLNSNMAIAFMKALDNKKARNKKKTLYKRKISS